MFRVTPTVMGHMFKVITEPLLIILVMTITVLLGMLILTQDLMEQNQQIVIMLHHQLIPHQPILHLFIRGLEVVSITTIVMEIRLISVDKRKL